MSRRPKAEVALLREVELVRNKAVDARYQDHVVVLRRGSVEADARSLIGTLGAGDVLEVRAHACFPGWVNFVESVQVFVSTTAG